jgi:hypothetical protein
VKFLSLLFIAITLFSVIEMQNWVILSNNSLMSELEFYKSNDYCFFDHSLQGGLEDILGSKQKDSHNFKENLVTFWDTIVRES